jgi:hypothetical protein
MNVVLVMRVTFHHAGPFNALARIANGTTAEATPRGPQ